MSVLQEGNFRVDLSVPSRLRFLSKEVLAAEHYYDATLAIYFVMNAGEETDSQENVKFVLELPATAIRDKVFTTDQFVYRDCRRATLITQTNEASNSQLATILKHHPAPSLVKRTIGAAKN